MKSACIALSVLPASVAIVTTLVPGMPSGVAAVAGLGASARWRTGTRPATATAAIIGMAALQLLAFR